MAGLEYATTNVFLKPKFDKLVDVIRRKYPLLSMLKKSPWTSTGRYVAKTLKYSPGGGLSAGSAAAATVTRGNTGAAGSLLSGFSVAQANVTAPQAVECQLPLYNFYGVQQADGPFMAVSKGNDAAYIKGIMDLLKDAITQVDLQLSVSLFGTGRGSFGQVQAVTAGTAGGGGLGSADGHIHMGNSTLGVVPAQTNCLEVGMYLKFAATNEYAACRADYVQVSKIDRVNGIVYYILVADSDDNNITADDYVFIMGHAIATASTALTGAKVFPGLQGWCPSSASSSFLNFDQTLDSRLAGYYIAPAAGAYGSREELLIDVLGDAAAINGAEITHIVTSTYQFQQMLKEVGGKVTWNKDGVASRDQSGPRADLSFASLSIWGASGIVQVFADPHCPKMKFFGFNEDTIGLISPEKTLPHTLAEDGNKILRVYNGDVYEARCGAYTTLDASEGTKDLVHIDASNL